MKILTWFKNKFKKKEISYHICRNKSGEVFHNGEPMEIYRTNDVNKPLVFEGIDVLNNNKPKLWYVVPMDWDINSLPLEENPHG